MTADTVTLEFTFTGGAEEAGSFVILGYIHPYLPYIWHLQRDLSTSSTGGRMGVCRAVGHPRIGCHVFGSLIQY